MKMVSRSLASVLALVVISASPALAQTMVASVPTQLSVGVGGTGPDNESDRVVLSPNSGISAFESLASNLVDGDTNERGDVFLRDANGVITRETVSSDGVQGDKGGRSPA